MEAYFCSIRELKAYIHINVCYLQHHFALGFEVHPLLQRVKNGDGSVPQTKSIFLCQVEEEEEESSP